MNRRQLWFQSAIVIALAAWRLASPGTADAAPMDMCGRVMCGAPGCSDAGFNCAECPGYTCTTTGTAYCFGEGVSSTIYCWAHE